MGSETVSHEGFVLRIGVAAMDFARIHAWLAASYWSKDIGRERVEKGFRASAVCVGAFIGDAQIGVARCVSDTTRFAYIMDVFVPEDHRGKGVARAMIRELMAHPLVCDVDSWYLITRDAQPLYSQLGFEVFQHPQRFMCRRKVK